MAWSRALFYIAAGVVAAACAGLTVCWSWFIEADGGAVGADPLSVLREVRIDDVTGSRTLDTTTSYVESVRQHVLLSDSEGQFVKPPQFPQHVLRDVVVAWYAPLETRSGYGNEALEYLSGMAAALQIEAEDARGSVCHVADYGSVTCARTVEFIATQHGDTARFAVSDRVVQAAMDQFDERGSIVLLPRHAFSELRPRRKFMFDFDLMDEDSDDDDSHEPLPLWALNRPLEPHSTERLTPKVVDQALRRHWCADHPARRTLRPPTVVEVCHSEPGAWSVPKPRYKTERPCPWSAPPLTNDVDEKGAAQVAEYLALEVCHHPSETDEKFFTLMKDRLLSLAVSNARSDDPAYLGPSGSEGHGSTVTVGRTMFETDRVPLGWIPRLASMDEIWVPTEFMRDVILRTKARHDELTSTVVLSDAGERHLQLAGGATLRLPGGEDDAYELTPLENASIRIVVVPESIDVRVWRPWRQHPKRFHIQPPRISGATGELQTERYDVIQEMMRLRYALREEIDAPENLDVSQLCSVRFLSVFKWEDRKGWDVLIQAFVEATVLSPTTEEPNSGKGPCLFIKTEPYAQTDGQLEEGDAEGYYEVIQRHIALTYSRSRFQALQKDANGSILSDDEFLARHGLSAAQLAWLEEHPKHFYEVNRLAHDELRENRKATAARATLRSLAERGFHSGEDLEGFMHAWGTLPKDRLPLIVVLPDPVQPEYMPFLYAHVDCLVQPSRGEGWGRPQMEAMAVGLPVITTNWSGPTAFIEHNVTGLLVDTEPELRTIVDGPFRGHKFAEPRVADLVRLLRYVARDPDAVAATIGAAGAASLQGRFDSVTLGKMLLRHAERAAIEKFG
jgi:glycosyltransferase involved in cell wall biosynthesis